MVWSNRLQTGILETFLSNIYSFKHKASALCEATRTSFARAQMYFCKANLQTELNCKIRINEGQHSLSLFPHPLTGPKKEHVAPVFFQQTKTFWFWDVLNPLQTIWRNTINNRRLCEFIRKIKELLSELNAFNDSFNDLSMSTKHYKFLKNIYCCFDLWPFKCENGCTGDKPAAAPFGQDRGRFKGLQRSWWYTWTFEIKSMDLPLLVVLT